MKKKEEKSEENNALNNTSVELMKKYPEAFQLSIGLRMCGIDTNIHSCVLILKVQESVKKMGDKFDIRTAIDLKLAVEKLFIDELNVD